MQYRLAIPQKNGNGKQGRQTSKADRMNKSRCAPKAENKMDAGSHTNSNSSFLSLDYSCSHPLALLLDLVSYSKLPVQDP